VSADTYLNDLKDAERVQVDVQVILQNHPTTVKGKVHAITGHEGPEVE
jgi:hypothetical protein